MAVFPNLGVMIPFGNVKHHFPLKARQAAGDDGDGTSWFMLPLTLTMKKEFQAVSIWVDGWRHCKSQVLSTATGG